jgi:hypothetical protein
LHTRTAARPLIADNDHITSLHAILENVGDGIFLALAYVGSPLEHQEFIFYPGGFYNTTILGNVSKENR